MTVVKICGMRSLAEARVAIDVGADLLGFIFWKPGKRYIAPSEAACIIDTLRAEATAWSAVGVFVDPTLDEVRQVTDACHLDFIQLSGQEPADLVKAMPRPTLKALHVRAGQERHAAETVVGNTLRADRYLLDTHADDLPGGTGRPFDWDALSGVGPTCLVAGGLRPDNVAGALGSLSPYGVDVSSGVEFPSGGKDPRLIRAFVEAVRSYDQRAD
ncbi:MAG: phosphoribosylanthranilate isomerase [Chloroflexi bacterium]|nr:phosphoribosylanthranilate isomerase [Chloroflexota bacterium]MBV9602118.1 phosphoribosylanthranilate isomerase [Chloroflexota bacterium]